MAALTFNKCCCCVDLRLGCLILGYINLVISIILTVLSLIGLIFVNVAANVVMNDSQLNQDKKMQVEVIAVIVNAISIILLIILAVNLALSIVLLVGIHKNKPGHVLTYIIFDFIFIIVSIIIFITQMSQGKNDCSTIVSSILSIAFSIYIFLVLRSYYYKMKEENTNGAIYSA